MIDEDLEPLVTRCPNCSTQFRVTENQLAAAGGRVRCGACLTVFEGTEHLILDSDGTFSDGSEADAALDALLDELVNADAPRRVTDIETPLPGLTDDLPMDTGSVEAVQLYGGFEDEQAPEAAVQTEDAEGETADADDAADSADPVAAAGVTSEEPEAVSAEVQADYEAWIRPGIPNIDQLVDEVVASGAQREADADAVVDTDAEAPPAPERALKLSTVEQSLAEEGVGISPIRFAPEPRRWWVPITAAALVVMLIAQILYLQLPQWSKDPGMRGLYEGICGVFGCELPKIRAVDAFRTRNLMVRSHPDLRNALVIDAVIVNTADFPQRFPDLELRFTSVGGLLVAARIFAPEEYLAGEARPGELVPVNTPVQVSIEIADPGDEAVNYTLSFR